MSNPETTVFAAAGGAEALRHLVNEFYLKVGSDPDLSPIFPDDLTEIREKQYMFLTQFFGGPALYSQAYGAPMLRARHMHFAVTPTRVDAWLRCMSEALDETGFTGELRDFMFERMTLTAHHMLNTPTNEEPLPQRPMLKVEAQAKSAKQTPETHEEEQ